LLTEHGDHRARERLAILVEHTAGDHPAARQLHIDVGALLAIRQFDRRARAERAALTECAIDEAGLRRRDVVSARREAGDTEAPLIVGRRGARPSAARHHDARPLDGAAGVGGRYLPGNDCGPYRHSDIPLRLQSAATPSGSLRLPALSPLSGRQILRRHRDRDRERRHR
jgi:hypothetical protein